MSQASTLATTPQEWNFVCSFFVLVWFLCLMAYQLLLFNAKAILEEQWWYYLIHSWEDKGVHTFPKGICLKVNVIARLEFELAYYDSAVQRFNHYTMRTPPFVLKTFVQNCICVLGVNYIYWGYGSGTLRECGVTPLLPLLASSLRLGVVVPARSHVWVE